MIGSRKRKLWPTRGWAAAGALAVVACAGAFAACAGADSTSGSGKVQVVAAENFWGSLASQLGGDKVTVRSIISSPDTDPHAYEAKPEDARAVATAQYVVFNGVSYDPWVDRLLAANGSKTRIVLKVQDLLKLKDDDNPHRWYSPDDVAKVIDQMVADYKTIDSKDAAYFDQQASDFKTKGLKAYNDSVAQIRQKYAGTPIGATESIVSPLSDALGLKMLTPPAFLNAISEGTDPTAKDKATFDDQIARKQIAVLVFNTQNATPDVQRLVDAAKAKGIAVASVTETLDPPNTKFQDWQAKQLQGLADALARATGK